MMGSSIAKEIDEEYKRKKVWLKMNKKRKDIQYEKKKGQKEAL